MRDSLLASRAVRISLGALLALVGFVIIALPNRSGLHELTVKHFTSESPVYNRTLGFQKVFAIGFSSRSDKRDALSVASSFSEIDLTWSEGVLVDDMPAKAIPDVFEDATFVDSAIGCWRAHLNVLRTIVDEQIQTALVLEDDDDWDVNIKAQLHEFAKGVVALQNDEPGTSPQGSPYGNNWDLLWLGHCHAGPRDVGPDGSDVQKMYFISNDDTVPPTTHRFNYWQNSHILPEVLYNDTRIIFRTGQAMCTWGQAITLKAARKVLTTLSIEGRIGRQIDGALSQLSHDRNLTSYAIYPPLFSSYHFAGSKFRDSDIMDHSEDKHHDAFSHNLVYSTLVNMPRLEDGAVDVLSQWPKETIAVRRLDQNYGADVTGELREVNLKVLPKKSVLGVNARGKLDKPAFRQLMSDMDL